ncbi:importin-11 [Naegleria gruberi]|uniref:Importin-11 n=1 Tax=Naegleria gruberi TaxID=5762 RepID=D2VP25_NAEGR|nr:importin-11 [Naegleria gruberi]EFC41357.1 importin-11 [Naegleria gruberi]|eukprot:XP_002674101.1 importin-11 [Naegleria gruberi]
MLNNKVVQSREQFPSLSPNDEAQLVEVLTKSLNGGTEEQKIAENTLHQVEKRNGYLSLLLQIITKTTVEQQARYLALICLKNSVDTYWRPSANYVISNQEKEYVKQGLLKLIISDNNDELLNNNQFIIQFALSIAKIARIDYPTDWKDLIENIVQCITSSSSEQVRSKCLIVLKQFVKEQSSKNLVEAKKIFKEFSQNIVGFTCQLWFYYANRIYQSIGNINDLEYNNCLVCSRIIWRLIAMGISVIDKNSTIMDFLGSLSDIISKYYQVSQSLITSGQNRTENFDKIICLLASFIKIPLRVQSKHQIGFRKLLLPYCMIFSKMVFENDPYAPTTDFKVFFRALTFLKFVVECTKYDKDNGNEGAEAFEIVHNQFFTDEVLRNFVSCLVTKYMVASGDELDKWNEDPEEFVKEQELDRDDTLKAAGEYLFLAIMGTFESRISKFVVQFTEQMLQETYGSLENQKIILRDACYSAVGWASYHLYNDIQFPQWYASMLRKELLPTEEFALNPKYNVIRRKCMWILGRWVERFDPTVRKDILQTLMTILTSSNDIVLQLTSLITLKTIISEDIDFEPNDFVEHLEPFMKILIHILSNVEQEDTKLSLLTLISFVVEKMDNKILPYCEVLVKMLPVLWNSCFDSTLVKTQVISALSKIVKLLESNSVILYEFLLPLISYSTDVEQEEHAYFIEDALELWHSTVQYAPEPVQGLMSIFPNLVKIIDTSYDYLVLALRIIESYILLGKSQFLGTFGSQLNEIFLNILNNAKPKVIYICTNIIDLIFTEFPLEASTHFIVPVKHMMEMFYAKEEKNEVLVNFLCVFSRLLFFNKNLFFQISETIQKEKSIQQGSVSLDVIDLWISLFDSIVSSFHRKFSTLALLSLYPTNNNELLNRFGKILNISVQVLYDMDKQSELTKRLTGEDEEDGITMNNEFDRKRLSARNDVLIQMDFYDYLHAKMNEMAQMVGNPNDFKLFLQSIADSETLTRLESFKKSSSSSPSLI